MLKVRAKVTFTQIHPWMGLVTLSVTCLTSGVGGLATSDTLLQVTQPGLSEQQGYVTPAWVEPLQGPDPPGPSTSCLLMELTLNRAGPLLLSAGLGQWPNSVPAAFTKARQGKAVFRPSCSWQEQRRH